MNKIDTDWLEEFDEAMLGLFAINHSDAGMDEALLVSYYDLEPREAALAFGNDYDLDRAYVVWPPVGLLLNS
ncbi:hypothetical protein HH110_15430 [Stenotrophomonas sp. SAM-B]|uniref:hypothetical protein n=1 Tax=Stenotrophomonas TaxID=40323 RepID=UPI0015A4A7A5|nr:hypothetical protein [Stenotrophomonas sp. SAM-B]NWF34430.1 hypothetical protein [Stenotrophomonas sp. SAM-B]